MSASSKLLSLLGLLAFACAAGADAGKRTACTITVNSADEKAVFRRYLPPDQYDFVELVDRDRSDWLASACSRQVRCDVLVISGHFNGSYFFSDQLDVQASLPVQEMERVSCSDSCPGLFSQLKEVYLFGCTTLDPEGPKESVGEIARDLVRSGRPRAEAERTANAMIERHRESNRDFMRRVFRNVPVIYGFSSVAPLGASAAPMLARYFQGAGRGEVGSGRPSRKLLSNFSSTSFSVAPGLTDADARASYRREVCQFVDDRVPAAQKLRFIHDLMHRDIAEARLFFERIERFLGSVSETDRQAPAFVQALSDITADERARERYLAIARDADRAAIRARMIKVARSLGWLSADAERTELAAMIGALLAADKIGITDVDLACSLNDGHALDQELAGLQASAPPIFGAGNAAVLACLGSADGRERTLEALTSNRQEDVEAAEVYLRHHPFRDVDELRRVVASIAAMPSSAAQARAIDVLARHYLSDSESLEELLRLYPVTASPDVQRAIAGVVIRSDYQAIASADVVRMLREHRLKPSPGDVVDILIRRLQRAHASSDLHARS